MNHNASEPPFHTEAEAKINTPSESLTYSLGSILFNRFEVFGVRSGGMGKVYFVEDINTGELYAAKTLPFNDETTQEKYRFIEEAKVWLEIPPHPHIAKAHFVELERHQPFLFIEYVSNGELNNLRDLLNSMGRLSVRSVVNYAYQICLAMEFINRPLLRLVHGDLKPENLLLSSEGKIKISDFGLSKRFDAVSGTFPKELAGSLPYMSPEHLSGEVLDQHSDIFSYGIVIYELAFGQLPFPFILDFSHGSKTVREQLKDFYENLPFYDDSRFSPWPKPKVEDTFSNEFWEVIVGCINPVRSRRWYDFQEIRKSLERNFGNIMEMEDQGEEIAPSNLHQKALSLYKMGQISESLTVFNKALNTEPHNPLVWRDAAVALIEAGMKPQAREFAIRAYQLAPELIVNDSMLRTFIE